MKSLNKFLKDILKGSKPAIARAITIVENDSDYTLLKKLFRSSGKAYYVGITGPPGAGKSTLVNAIAKLLLKKKKRIGIIAVDPTSPFSGGALLGDRVRMTDLALNKNVFIRSMASRGSLGGLAQKTKDVALVLDAAGMDYILIETIGVGQVELDIAQVCDTTAVVGAVPGWSYPIIKTIATTGDGVDQVVVRIEEHRRYLTRSGKLESARKERLFSRINELIEERIRADLHKRLTTQPGLKKIIDDIYNRRRNPFDVAEKILRNSGFVF
ncbi:hypothetical protein BXT86_06305 [candidate division WOR-3 bacterium 4484_100]|uniref:AAA+ ATPase domain-containing protein n=1 Tax=candidate division WOR-3 bacterium 4484_100 TaxID=1936077 RepID=A0A1V4QER7_UNCW3|nr:MAG: hypothetical protein BXT86_06305 [candidate division WOR-3 bacterium 4484_100]